VTIELSQSEARQLLSGLDKAGYQIESLAKKVEGHDEQFEELFRLVNELKITAALMTASKTRSDLQIQALPDYFKKIDMMYDGFLDMKEKGKGIYIQSWSGLILAIAISIGGVVFSYIRQPSKSEKAEADVRSVAITSNLKPWKTSKPL
jgi:hypothetical protein